MPKIVLIEDNKDISYANKVMLELEGYDVLTAATVQAGKKLVLQSDPDLIILDVMLPDGNGIDLCRELMMNRKFNVIFLSALSEKNDVLEGLKAGGYDYITKPYIMEELLLRVKNNLRRSETYSDGFFAYGNIRFKPHALTAEYEGNSLALNPKEYALLDLLCRNSGRYLSSEFLLENVWNLTDGSVQPLYNCLSTLREKISGTRVLIDFKRGSGYMVRAEE